MCACVNPAAPFPAFGAPPAPAPAPAGVCVGACVCACVCVCVQPGRSLPVCLFTCVRLYAVCCCCSVLGPHL
ncbi:MAG: hypothetical protein P4L40_24515 [Terracidiphilus sp.]|nr:hypothetical protein [Terracidiphilus sp.]